jgi:hypothetical protein
MREHILLVLMIIPIIALALDRLFFALQRGLFPHRYGGMGLLNRGLRVVLQGWENLKGLFWKPTPIPGASRPAKGAKP